MKRSPSIPRSHFSILLLLLATFLAHAEENHWNGNAGNNLWLDGGNWSQGHPPGSFDNVYLDSATDSVVILNTNAQLNLLNIGGPSGTQRLVVTNATLTFSSGRIAGNGILDLASPGANSSVSGGTFTNSGTIVCSSGTNSLSTSGGGSLVNAGAFQASTNASLILQTTGSFIDGTRFNGPGTVEFSFPGQVNCNGTMYVDGTFTFGGGAVSGYNTWRGPGMLNWKGGQFMQGTTRFSSDLLVNLLGIHSAVGASMTITNDATIHWWTDSKLDSFAPAVFENHGAILLHTNADFGPLVVKNFGRILAVQGTVTLKSVSGEFTNWGIFQADTNTTLILYLQNVSFTRALLEDGTRFDGPGNIRFFFDTLVQCEGNMFVNTSFTFDGMIAGSNTWHGPGTFNWTGGQFNDGAIRLASDLSVNAVGPKLQIGQFVRVTNDSTIHWFSDEALNSFGSDNAFFENRGTIALHTNAEFGNMVVENFGKIQAVEGAVTFKCVSGAFTNWGTFQADTNTTLVLNLQNKSYEDYNRAALKGGTSFDGPGNIALFFNTILQCEGDMFVNTSFTFDGIVSGTNTWHGPGTFNWTNGRFNTGRIRLASDLPVNALGSKLQIGRSIQLTNDSTIHWLSGDTFTGDATDDAIFENDGTIVLHTNFSATGLSLNNAGIIAVLSGDKTLHLASDYYAHSPLINSGSFQVASNATLTIDDADTQLNSGTVFNGSVAITSVSIVHGLGDIVINGSVTCGGSLAGTNIWHGPGSLNLTKATLSNGATTFTQNLLVNNPDFTILAPAQLTNYTSLNLQQTPFSFGIGGTIQNNGVITATNCNFFDGAVNNFGTLKVDGETTFGEFHNFGAFVLNDGNTTLSMADFQFSNVGTLDLRRGSLAVSSSSLPPFFPPQPLPNLGHCKFALGGTNPILDYPRLSIVGFTSGVFPGTIQASLTNNFAVTNGSTFNLVTGNTIFNSFPSGADLQIPSLPGNLSWRVLGATNSTDFILRAVSPAFMQNAAQLTNGTFQFTISGGAGSDCIVETSPDLKNWVPLQTNSPYTGTFDFVDPNATNAASFYRFQIND